MPFVGNQYYNNPQIGAGFAGLAKMFEPPSAQELAAYATAKATREKAERAQELADAAKSGASRAEIDRLGIGSGAFNPNQSYYSVDLGDATTRRGQELSLQGTKYTADSSKLAAMYGHDKTFEASRANNTDDNTAKLSMNTADNQNKLDVAMLSPVAQGATRFVPPAQQKAYGVPPMQIGTINAGQGDTVYSPDGRTLSGAEKPLSETETKGAFWQDFLKRGVISQQQAADSLLGDRPPVQAVGADGKPVFIAAGEAVRTGATPYSPEGAGKQIDMQSKLRGEIAQLPSYKNYAQAAPIYRSMVDTAGRDTKASDLNLVYGLGKIMDPTSVVREGEAVMVKDTASLPDWFQGAVNRLNGGAALTPDTRAALMREAYSRMSSYEDILSGDLDRYGQIVDRNGLNRLDVLPRLERSKPYQRPAAATAEPLATGPAGGSSLPAPRSAEEFRQLQSGAKYRAPDGSTRVKP